MTESKSPVICVTCHRPFAPGLKEEEAPSYFAQYYTFPSSDAVDGFANEVKTLLEYIETLSHIARWEDKVEDHRRNNLLELIHDLTEEARRRNDFTLSAIEEILKHQDASSTGEEERRA